MSAGNVEYRTEPPEAEAYAALFETTGWNARYRASAMDLRRALAASRWIVAAYVAGRLAGFGRVMSDGVLYAILFDVIVHPDFRRRGIGGEIVRRLVASCAAAGVRDVQLFSAAGKTAFYERLGFRVRPAEAPGMRLEAAPAGGESDPPGAAGA